MKKLILMITTLLTSVFLVACHKAFFIAKQEADIIIHKLIMGRSYENSVLELKNISDSAKNLKNYSIRYFKKSSQFNELTLPNKELKPGEFFSIGNIEATLVKTKGDTSTGNAGKTVEVDLLQSKITFGYSKRIELKKESKTIDVYGQKDAKNTLAEEASLYRFAEFEKNLGETHLNFVWCLFKVEYYNSLDKNCPLTYAEVMQGPKPDLTKLVEDKVNGGQNAKETLIQNILNKTPGNGEIIPADKVLLYKDGDTTDFQISYTDSKTGTKVEHSIATRYAYCDTPEKGKGVTRPEPFANQATNLTHDLHESAKTTYLQTIPRGQIDGSFGRYFLVVWAGQDLVAFKLTKNGLNEKIPSRLNISDAILYNDIPLEYYIEMAFFYAEQKRLNLAYEYNKDPYFNYRTGKFRRGHENARIKTVE